MMLLFRICSSLIDAMELALSDSTSVSMIAVELVYKRWVVGLSISSLPSPQHFGGGHAMRIHVFVCTFYIGPSSPLQQTFLPLP